MAISFGGNHGYLIVDFRRRRLIAKALISNKYYYYFIIFLALQNAIFYIFTFLIKLFFKIIFIQKTGKIYRLSIRVMYL